MTTTEADDAMLASIDARWNAVRQLLADKKLCNPEWRTLTDATKGLTEDIHLLLKFRDHVTCIERRIKDHAN